MVNEHLKDIQHHLDMVEDLDVIIKVRNRLLECYTLEEFVQEMADSDEEKIIYYLHEFARAHEEMYGD